MCIQGARTCRAGPGGTGSDQVLGPCRADRVLQAAAACVCADACPVALCLSSPGFMDATRQIRGIAVRPGSFALVGLIH